MLQRRRLVMVVFSVAGDVIAACELGIVAAVSFLKCCGFSCCRVEGRNCLTIKPAVVSRQYLRKLRLRSEEVYKLELV
jgi:hypothetical protein